jgi:hypothetical protein
VKCNNNIHSFIKPSTIIVDQNARKCRTFFYVYPCIYSIGLYLFLEVVVLFLSSDLVLVAFAADVNNVLGVLLATASAATGAVVETTSAAGDEVDERPAVDETVTVERVDLGKRW